MTQAIFRVISGDTPTVLTTIFTAGPNQWFKLLGMTLTNADVTLPSTTFRSVLVEIGGVVFLGGVLVASLKAFEYGPEGVFLLRPGDTIRVLANDTGMKHFMHLEAVG